MPETGGGLKESVCEMVHAGNLAEAINTLEVIVLERPRDAEAHELLGCVYHRAGRPDEAVAAFRRAVFLSPDDSSYLYNLATGLYASGDCSEALLVVSECLKRRPEHGEARKMQERLNRAGFRLVPPPV
ncbi:MAG: tetratricopeptide repeat protein [Armatimonadetes bacterium]|nr:tetratricopeptide repeat protein [Armatimonadota bacterium]